MLGFLISVVVIAIILGILKVSTVEDTTQTGSITPSIAESETAKDKTEARPPTATRSSQSSEASKQGAATKGYHTVKISLNGLPDGAKVKVDGNFHPNPIELPKSDTPVKVVVQAPGYVSQKNTIVPTKNQTLSMALKKVPEKKQEVKK